MQRVWILLCMIGLFQSIAVADEGGIHRLIVQMQQTQDRSKKAELLAIIRRAMYRSYEERQRHYYLQSRQSTKRLRMVTLSKRSFSMEMERARFFEREVYLSQFN